MADRTCLVAGAPLPAKAPKVCMVDGCARMVCGRGWCKMHLRRWERHGDPTYLVRPRSTECSHIGCDNPGPYRKSFCNRCYIATTRWAGVPVGPVSVNLGKPRRRRTPTPREHGTARGYGQHFAHGDPMCEPCRIAKRVHGRIRRGATHPTECRHCATPIPPRPDDHPRWSSPFCTPACARKAAMRRNRRSPSGRAAKARRRAAVRGKGGKLAEKFDPVSVYERDQWTCQSCRRKVNRAKVHPHPTAPTLDHIIPLSRGGEHTQVNTQLLCSKCNMSKGNRAANDQLRLIG